MRRRQQQGSLPRLAGGAVDEPSAWRRARGAEIQAREYLQTAIRCDLAAGDEGVFKMRHRPVREDPAHRRTEVHCKNEFSDGIHGAGAERTCASASKIEVQPLFLPGVGPSAAARV